MGRDRLLRALPDGSMAVPLTRSLEAIVDAVDAAEVGKFAWTASVRTTNAYAYRTSGRTTLYLHRFIATCMGVPLTLHVDHVDRNGLDCRRKNLRACTPAQNCVNREASSRWGLKGVEWDPRRGTWRARIEKDGNVTHLGTFEDATSAALAYDRAALETFGEFAFLNFPAPGALS